MNIANLFDEGAFVLGALLIAGSVAMFRRTRTFIARCHDAEGRIAGYATDESDDGVSYYPLIRFRDEAGVEHEIRDAGGLQRPPKVGKRAALTYDPAHPTNAWRTGSAAPWIIPWFVLLAGIAAILAGFVIRAEGG